MIRDTEIVGIWEECKRKMNNFNIKYEVKNDYFKLETYGVFYNILQLKGFLEGFEFYYYLSKNPNFIKAEINNAKI